MGARLPSLPWARRETVGYLARRWNEKEAVKRYCKCEETLERIQSPKERKIDMALTRSFKDTIRKRAARDPEFRESLLRESVECMLASDVDTGKSILRDYINATIGFEKLGTRVGKSSKSLMRMLSPRGNPTASNLFEIIGMLKENEGINFEVHTVH